MKKLLLAAFIIGTAFSSAFAQTRTLLTANLTINVNSSTGTDAATCVTGTSTCKTLQYAWSTLQALYDLGGYNVTISCSTCRDSGINISGPLVGQTALSALTLVGDTSNPANATITGAGSADAISLSGGPRVLIEGFTLSAPGGGSCLHTDGAAEVNHSNMAFGACTIQQFAHVGSRIVATGNFSIVGNASYAFDAAGSGAWLEVQSGVMVTLTGTPTFAITVFTTETGLIDLAGVTWSGAANSSSLKCAVENGAILYTGGTLSSIPGSPYSGTLPCDLISSPAS